MIHISEDLTSTTNPLSNSTTHPQVVVSDSKPNTSRIFYPSQQEFSTFCPMLYVYLLLWSVGKLRTDFLVFPNLTQQ